MATRYYPTTRAPWWTIYGRLQGDWDGSIGGKLAASPTHPSWLCSTSKTDAGELNTASCKTNQQGNFDAAMARWQTPPLEAQTVSGTFNLCFQVQATWIDAVASPTNDSVVRYKVHVYIAVGTTTAVRHTLLDNHVDSANFPGTSGAVWKSLASAQAVTSGDAQAGDTIIIEIGARIVSSPTPTPSYPPTNYTSFPMRGVGVNATAGTPLTDAVDGDTSSAKAPWFEFSDTLTEAAAEVPAAPANDACADATVIASLPYQSGDIVTVSSADTQRRVWFRVTATQTGWMSAACFGSNYMAEVGVYLACGGSAATIVQVRTSIRSNRCQSFTTWECTNGTEYWLRVQDASAASSDGSAPNSGGVLRLRVVNWTDPQEDDLYIPAGVQIIGLRDAAFHVGTSLGSTVTGVAFDYTQRTIDDFNGGTNSNERVLIGLHDFELVEVLDLPTLNANEAETEFIGDPFTVPGVTTHTAQLEVTPDGELFAGWFGNGYLMVLGDGTLPSILNDQSNVAAYGSIKHLDATFGDNQAGAPYTASVITPAVDITAPWAIALDPVNGIIYYTSGGFYMPVGGQVIKRWEIGVGQMADFATIPVDASSPNPGLKGMEFLPGGGLLVCNGSQVVRLSADGDIVMTYEPSITEDATSLLDVVLTADGLSFWVIDLYSTRLFRFDIATGEELETAQPYLAPAALIQMAVYQPDGADEPPPPEGGDPPEEETGPPGEEDLDEDGEPDEPTGETWTLLRVRRSAHVTGEQGWAFYKAFALDVETGVGDETGEDEAVNPKMMMRFSDDKGKTWSDGLWRNIGPMGAYGIQVIWERLGRARQRLFEVSTSSPVTIALLDAYLHVTRGRR
jgi:hypothetical protein